MVSTEVSKLNHAIMKKQGDQMQFSLKKGLGKKNESIHPIIRSIVL